MEPEIHFVTDQAVAVPDLPGWRTTRMPRIPQGHRFEVVPSWVCEILSPAAANRESGGQIARAATREGLPAPDALEQILRERLRALRLARLDAARRRLAQAPGPPMTAEEIQAEIEAYRAEQQPRGRNRLSRICFPLRLVSA